MRRFFDEAFKNFDIIPEELQKFSEDVCESFGIYGLADPVYIVNVTGRELELGTTFVGFNMKNIKKSNYEKVGELLEESCGRFRVEKEEIVNKLKKHFGKN